MLRINIALALLAFLILFFTVAADTQTPTQIASPTPTPDESVAGNTDDEGDIFLADEVSNQTPSEPIQLNFQELCKTPEGQSIIRQKINSFDLKSQWEGMLFNEQTKATYDEYKTEHVKMLCGQPDYVIPGYQLRPFSVGGTCENLKFEAYNVDAIVREAQDLDSYYLSPGGLGNLTLADRTARRNEAIKQLLRDKEAEMEYYYSKSGCNMGREASCYMHHFSTKVICSKTYIDAPADHEFVRSSIKVRGSVKRGPGFESNNRLWFRVGSSTMGEEKFGTVEIRTLVTAAGAKRMAIRDIDVIRRKLKVLGLPIDREPQIIVPQPTPQPTPKPEVPSSRPGQLVWKFRAYKKPADRQYEEYADLEVTNIGGSPKNVNFEIVYYEGFFTTNDTKPKCLFVTTPYNGITLNPGQTYKTNWIQYHAAGIKINKIDQTKRLLACILN